MQKLLDVNGVADLLGLSVKTIYMRICKKTIPYIKIGASVRFDPEEIRKWIQEQTVTPIPERWS